MYVFGFERMADLSFKQKPFGLLLQKNCKLKKIQCIWNHPDFKLRQRKPAWTNLHLTLNE